MTARDGTSPGRPTQPAGTFDWSMPAVELAPRLLGATLERRDDDGQVRRVEIVETEAYPGGADRASHTFDGRRTPRNDSMYRAGGHLYVYLIYGLHHCLNVVSGRAEEGEAVLLRAARASSGLDRMRAARSRCRRDVDLCRGPGRLAAALGIDRSHDGVDLRTDPVVRLLPRDRPLERDAISCGVRIGLGNVGPWIDRPWRWWLADAAEVSATRRPGAT